MERPAEKIVVLDFGGQYAHLIANRIRRLGVYSEIVQAETPAKEVRDYAGIILSGSPHSVLERGSPTIDKGILDLNIPILGLCYGHQLIARLLGGTVIKGQVREYGSASLRIIKSSPLFAGFGRDEQVWMSHGDTVETLPPAFEIFGSTSDCAAAAVGNSDRRIYGLQFHPEVTDTPHGMKLLDNFLTICGCRRDWNPVARLDRLIENIRIQCGGRNVFLLVSGGVDSSVAFALLIKALGPDRVMGLHIDNGLMRWRESADILDYLKRHGFHNLTVEDASADFLAALAGVVDPEKKRVVIGHLFIVAKDKALGNVVLVPGGWMVALGSFFADSIV